MSRRSIHVVTSLSGGWAVYRTGGKRASRVLKSRSGAVAWAILRAVRDAVTLYIHGRDGVVLRRIMP